MNRFLHALFLFIIGTIFAFPVFAASNTYNVKKMKIGDRVASMKIVGIDKVNAKEKLSLNNAIIDFNGTATLTGNVEYYYEDSAFTADSVCMSVSDKNSLKSLPRIKEEIGKNAFFCFDNTTLAQKLFRPEGSSGKATVTITSYRDVHFGGEVVNGARLSSVVKKSKRKLSPPPESYLYSDLKYSSNIAKICKKEKVALGDYAPGEVIITYKTNKIKKFRAFIERNEYQLIWTSDTYPLDDPAHKLGMSSFVVMRVPEGEERCWARELGKKSVIDSADPNWFGTVAD